MKSIKDFETAKEYWDYVHTQATINVMCVLVSKPEWESNKDIAKQASKIADEVVKVLSK